MAGMAPQVAARPSGQLFRHLSVGAAIDRMCESVGQFTKADVQRHLMHQKKDSAGALERNPAQPLCGAAPTRER